jgi:alpha-L-rhamnosidase
MFRRVLSSADCPQRDERKGWLGDAAVSAEEALYNFDLGAVYTSWLDEMLDDQRPDGAFPDIIPAHGWWLRDGAPTYQSAYPTIMWAMVMQLGDTGLPSSARHQRALGKYMDYLIHEYNSTKAAHNGSGAAGLAHFRTGYGDWQPPPVKNATGGWQKPPQANGSLVSSFSLLHDLRLLASLFNASANHGRATWCQDLYDRLTTEYHRAFYNESIYRRVRIRPADGAGNGARVARGGASIVAIVVASTAGW